MPASKKSADERMLACSLQQAKIKYQDKVKNLRKWINDRPDLVPQLHDTAETLSKAYPTPGAAPAASASLPMSAPPTSTLPGASILALPAPPAATAAASPSKAQPESPEKDAAAARTVELISKTHEYNYLQVSLKKLRKGLVKMEPCVLTMENLKKIAAKHDHLAMQAELLKLWEMATDTQADDKPSEYETWDDLYSAKTSVYEAKGRRCANVSFPINWQTMGLYSLLFDEPDASLVVHHKFKPAGSNKAKVPEFFVAQFPNIKALQIMNNHSETMACIVLPGFTGQSFGVWSLFSGCKGPAPSRTRTPLIEPVEEAPVILAKDAKVSGQKRQKLLLTDFSAGSASASSMAPPSPPPASEPATVVNANVAVVQCSAPVITAEAARSRAEQGSLLALPGARKASVPSTPASVPDVAASLPVESPPKKQKTAPKPTAKGRAKAVAVAVACSSSRKSSSSSDSED